VFPNISQHSSIEFSDLLLIIEKCIFLVETDYEKKAKQFTLKLKYEAFLKTISLKERRLDGLAVLSEPFYHS